MADKQLLLSAINLLSPSDTVYLPQPQLSPELNHTIVAKHLFCKEQVILTMFAMNLKNIHVSDHNLGGGFTILSVMRSKKPAAWTHCKLLVSNKRRMKRDMNQQQYFINPEPELGCTHALLDRCKT